MKKKITLFISFISLLFLFNFSEEALARKVICVDADPNDNGFLSNHEGWERQNMKPGDIILVGGPLDSCLKKVMNGDTLIIIAHGWGMGRGFVWGGVRYRGFGVGDSLQPVPPGFNNLMNVHVKFCSCWSARDPDGGGPDKPLTDKIRGAMGPPSNGNTAVGFTDKAFAANCVPYVFFPTQTDTGTINGVIRNNTGGWMKCPPVNRNPPVIPNQQTCLQHILDSIKGGPGRVTVGQITYKPPENRNLPLDTCFCDCNSDDNCGCVASEPLSKAIVTCTYAWTPQVSGTTNQLLTVHAVTSKIGWAAGVGPTVVKTIDGGATWTPATGVGIVGPVYNIYAVDKDTAFCTTTPGATFIYKTINGGITWTQVFTQAGGFIDAIQMVSPTEGYAIGDPVGGRWVILKTVDAGNTWPRMATEPVQVGSEAGWNNSFLIIGNDIWFGTNNTRVYHSINLGATWGFGATTGTTNSFAVHFNSNGASGLGLSGGSALVKSVNGGTTYAAVTNPAINVSGLEGNGTDWWAIAFNANVYHSINQGTNWTIVHTQGTEFDDIDFDVESDCAVGWAVGAGGNIARMEPSEFTKTLQFRVLIEGYVSCQPFSYIGDTVTVCINDATSPYGLVAAAQGKNDGNGNLTVSFISPIGIGPYYIVIKHRNSIETWSKSGGEAWPGTTLKYDFTSAAGQAFGNNMILKCGEYCVYSGDVNQDGVVDAADLSLIDNDAFNFVTGYVATDLNCDDIVDGADAAIADNNAFNFVSVIRP